jgi:hypothetical protein
LRKLHVELVKLQRWVVHKGLKVCIVFEGSTGLPLFLLPIAMLRVAEVSL